MEREFFDPFNVAHDRSRHATFARFRRMGDAARGVPPIPEAGKYATYLFSHAAVVKALRHPRLLQAPPGDYSEVRRALKNGLAFDLVTQSMLASDSPRHEILRRSVAGYFTAGAAEELEEQIARVAARLAEDCVRKGRFDLIADFTAPFGVEVLSLFLGMEFEDPRLLRRLTSGVWASLDFRKGPIPAAANDAAADLIDLVEAHLYTPRVETEGLVASLMQREVSGEWSREDVVASTVFLILAGQETVVEALNNAALALADHPQQRSALTRGEVSTESAAQELLRFDPPVPFSMLRIAAEGIVVAGVPLERGESVVAVLASANHDEAVFPQGHQLRLDRQPRPALSFGTGPHVCLGKHLALSEMRAALDALYRRMPHWEIDRSAIVRRNSIMFHGLASVPAGLTSSPSNTSPAPASTR